MRVLTGAKSTLWRCEPDRSAAYAQLAPSMDGMKIDSKTEKKEKKEA